MSFLLSPKSSSRGSTPRHSINSEGGLQQVELDSFYKIIREVGNGTYAKCVLAECRQTKKQMVIKLLHKQTTKLSDFMHELNISLFVSAHACILHTYSMALETPDFFAFTMEYAPLGDLYEFIQPNQGLPEESVKLVAKQIGSALEFLHSEKLCHRDVKPENIAVFEPDLSVVKLADFGMTRDQGVEIRKVSEGIPYTPPEIAQARKLQTYSAHPGTDVWSFGVLMVCSLTGLFPWQTAKESDPMFCEYLDWHKRKSLPLPSTFRVFSPRFLKLMRKLLEPKPHKRASITILHKYLVDDWTVLLGGRNCKAIRSFPDGHKELELGEMLENFGVKTRVDTKSKSRRVADWISDHCDSSSNSSSENLQTVNQNLTENVAVCS